MQEKKRRDQEEKKSKGRQDLINKILEENNKRMKIEVSITTLTFLGASGENGKGGT